jgi:hypothetical protein
MKLPLPSWKLLPMLYDPFYVLCNSKSRMLKEIGQRLLSPKKVKWAKLLRIRATSLIQQSDATSAMVAERYGALRAYQVDVACILYPARSLAANPIQSWFVPPSPSLGNQAFPRRCLSLSGSSTNMFRYNSCRGT